MPDETSIVALVANPTSAWLRWFASTQAKSGKYPMMRGFLRCASVLLPLVFLCVVSSWLGCHPAQLVASGRHQKLKQRLGGPGLNTSTQILLGRVEAECIRQYDPGEPFYNGLRDRHLLQMTRSGSMATVELTAQGKELFDRVGADPSTLALLPLDACGGHRVTLPLWSAELVRISDISQGNSCPLWKQVLSANCVTRAKVTYVWHLLYNDVTEPLAEIINHGPVEGFTQPQTSIATFRRFDDGWQIENIQSSPR